MFVLRLLAHLQVSVLGFSNWEWYLSPVTCCVLLRDILLFLWS